MPVTLLPSLRGAANRIRAHPYAIGGYACTFNQVFRRGGVPTIVAPGAFARAIIEGDWHLLLNHAFSPPSSPSQASTVAGTLHVEEDDYGLWFEAQLPDNPDGTRLMDQVRRREVCGVSAASHNLTVMEVNGIDVWSAMETWEISLMMPPNRAACPGTFVFPNLSARRHRLRVTDGSSRRKQGDVSHDCFSRGGPTP